MIVERDVTWDKLAKMSAATLQREGYDPKRVQDPLFLRDAALRAYVPLSAERLAQLVL